MNENHFDREPIVLRQPLELDSNEPITDQDNELLAKFKEYRYGPEKMTWDPNCYECKVRYRDPKAKDLVMYLHAWRYKVIVSRTLIRYDLLSRKDKILYIRTNLIIIIMF